MTGVFYETQTWVNRYANEPIVRPVVLPLKTVALQAMASPVRFPTAAEEECPAAAAPPAAVSSRDPVRSSLHSWS